MIKQLISLLFPPRCAFCGEVISGKIPICNNCIKNLPYINKPSCVLCGKSVSEFSHRLCSECKSEKKYFLHSFVPLKYSGIAKRAVIKLKFYHHPSYARAFAFLMAQKILSEAKDDVHFDFITYVPQNKTTKFVRGYNQSALIAKHLSEFLLLPLRPTLVRTNAGERQATLNKRARRENVRKCYFKGKDKISGNVLLVDDVYTTGATANYCAKLLRQMGADKVYLAISTIKSNE